MKTATVLDALYEEAKIQKEITGFSDTDFLVDSQIRCQRELDRFGVGFIRKIFRNLRELTESGHRIDVNQDNIENNFEGDLYRISVYSEIYRPSDDTIISKAFSA